MQQSRNLAARAGRWSARHRKIAILGWFAFVILAYLAGANTGTQLLTDENSGVGESGKATQIHADAYPKQTEEMVLVSSTKLKSDAPEFKAAVDDVMHRLHQVHGVEQIKDPYDANNKGSISPNDHAAMVGFVVPGDKETTKVKNIVDETVAQTEAAQKANPALIVEQFGDSSADEKFNEIFNEDLAKAGTLSLPVTLVVLLIAFGTLVAAGLPLLLAITAVMATMGLVGPLSQISPVEETINHVILLIGLAVGVDYALFYLRRAREERAAGKDADAALEAAAATSGHSVLVSGLTVMVSMAGMYLAGAPTFTSFATGTILVVAVAMVGSLTVLPAMMSKLGPRVDKGRVPLVGRLQQRAAGVGLWSRIVDRVLRRPAIAAGLSVALLIAMAIPALQLDTGNPPLGDSLPQDKPIVQTFNRLMDNFPVETSGLSLVVKGNDVTSPAVQDAIGDLEQAAAKDKDLFPGDSVEVDVTPDKTVATIELEIAGDGSNAVSAEALKVTRDQLVPETLGQVGGVQTYVDGQIAQDTDFNDTMKANLPLVFGFVMLAAFVLLLVTFRSIVVPIKAIVLNLLSVAASYGVLVLVFQHGWFKSLLGFSETGPITAWLPMFLFVVLFGLSMDYHVFILSRVREAVDRGMKTDDAVSHAIKTTAGVVTSAALVMVGVFAIFGSLSFVMFKQMGVGLAFAVLLDATLIRAVLLPASMKLLGERNWWLPKRLHWLPKIAHEGEVAPAHA
jgi:RND superfamily putative drug exporter